VKIRLKVITVGSFKLLFIYIVCASDEEIKNKMSGGYYELIFLDNLLDQAKLNDPYAPAMKSILLPGSLGTSAKFVNVYLRPNIFNNFENLFYYFGKA
jgi:hypothetical protein